MIWRWWRAYQRSLDRQLLWPACKEAASDLETARNMMLLHAAMDSAWSDVNAEEATQIIARWS